MEDEVAEVSVTGGLTFRRGLNGDTEKDKTGFEDVMVMATEKMGKCMNYVGEMA